MSDFQVLAPVKELERFSTDKGEFVVFEIGFSGDQGRGTIRHKRKSSSPAPAPGDTIDGEIVQGKDGPELKRIWKQGGGAPNGRSGGGFKPRDPKESAQIVRQHSQEMAMLHVASMERRGKLPEEWDLPALVKVIDWYQKDAESAVPQ